MRGARYCVGDGTVLRAASLGASFLPAAFEFGRRAAELAHLRRDYGSQRFSGLKEITPQNAPNLRVAWVYQMRGGG